MTDFRFFPRVFGDVVTAVRAEYDVTNNIKPVYEFGTYDELVTVSKLKDDNDIVKYPLVWLVWDARENTESWKYLTDYSVSPRVFICVETDSNYRSEQRYSENLEGILFPIWELIKIKMRDNSNIDFLPPYNFSKNDHLYWGESIGMSKDKNILFDTLDAIEINFNELGIYKTC